MRMAMLRIALLWMAMGALARVSSAPAEAAQAGAEKVAMVVGVQRYSETKGFAPLRYAERDAQSFYDLLVDPQRGGYEPARVKLFTTASQDPQQLPVRGNLLAALNHLQAWASTPGGGKLDTVLIYFSGHGVAEGGKSYLIPVDASRDDLASTAIGLDEVQARLAKCGAKKQIIILDACRFQTAPGKGPGEQQSLAFAKQLEQLGRAEGRVVLASCSADEASYEDQASQHSAFTAFLLQGLQGPADADADGVISVTESHEYVSRQMLSWSRQQDLEQTPRLYGEITLTIPLVHCPLWAELKITSVPTGAEVWIDDENTGSVTPYAEKVKLGGALQRTLRVRLKKRGYQELLKEVGLRAGVVAEITLPLEGQRRPGVHIPADLKPTSSEWVASTFFSGTGHVTALACRPDGSLLVAVASPHVVPPGVYLGYDGDLCDLSDAYTTPGAPFKMPDGVVLHPDGRVLVADASISTIWVIPAPGAAPQVLTREIPEPHDVLVAPPGFEGPGVHPRDLLVCGGSSLDPAAGGLYVVDQSTCAVHRLVGPPQLVNGLIHAGFGPDGKLYAMEDDRTRDGITIVTISSQGLVTPVVANCQVSAHLRQSGPLAVHPVTGDPYFAYGSSVYRVSESGTRVECFATGGRELAGLAFSADGSSLFVSDRAAGQVVRIFRPSPRAPTVKVAVQRGYLVSACGDVQYRQRALVMARDADGADDIESVTIVDPDAEVHTISSGSGMFGRGDDYTVICDRPATVWKWRKESMGQPPDTGPYTVIAADREGNRSAPLTTPTVPPAPRDWPRLLSPAPDSVIYTTTPTFEWTARVPIGGRCVLLVYDERASWANPTWRCAVGSDTRSAVYNFDGSAVQPQLEPNHTYLWVLETGGASSLPLRDPQLRSVDEVSRVEGRFTVYGDWPERPPELPGRLAYNSASMVGERQYAMAYGADPRTRAYLRGVDWSPDGTKVVYSSFGHIWIDSLDGSPPVSVPGPSGVNECRWGPDGRSLVYSTVGPWSPFFGDEGIAAERHFSWEAWHTSGADLGPMDRWSGNRDIWVTSIDGSHRYPVADSVEAEERWPAWSPDGLWIAYRKRLAPGASTHPKAEMPFKEAHEGAWLVRYDGAEDYPLVATGVVGHPDWGTHIDAAAWSPDGRKLAVQFNMGPGEGRWALGVMPAEGGPITPVFIPPPHAVCCAGPRFPQWSPDGTKIIFASAHHLPDASGQSKFVLGTELWMVNADGSGEPVRLTYDHLHQSWSSWWGPNTEAGTDVGVTKGDASVTFETVLEPGSTSLVAYVDAPGSLPKGFQFAGLRYELATTAKVRGSISLEIRYDRQSIPPGQEERLCLLQWQGDGWVDVTLRPVDTAGRLIHARCTTPGAFTLAIAPQQPS